MFENTIKGAWGKQTAKNLGLIAENTIMKLKLHDDDKNFNENDLKKIINKLVKDAADFTWSSAEDYWSDVVREAKQGVYAPFTSYTTKTTIPVDGVVYELNKDGELVKKEKIKKTPTQPKNQPKRSTVTEVKEDFSLKEKK